MIGKNLLNVVSALFIGSQLVSLAIADCSSISYTPDVSCTPTSCTKGFYKVFSSTGGTGEHTLDSTGQNSVKIVQVTADGVDGCVDVTTDDSCASDDDVGKYYATGDGVCIVGDGMSPVTAVFTESPAVNYLIPKAKATAFDFTDSEGTHDYVVLKSESNSIVFDGEYTTAEDTSGNTLEDCFDATTGTIMDSKSDFCANSAECDSYYVCSSGLCTLSEETNIVPKAGECVASKDGDRCPEGYNIIDGALYSCPSSAGSDCTPVTNPIGYYANANKQDASDAYIQCVRGAYVPGRRRNDPVYSYTCTTVSSTTTQCGDIGVYGDGTDIYLCLSASASPGSKLTAGKSYLISINSDGFLGIDNSSNKFIILNVDASKNASIQQYKATGEADDGQSSDTIRYKYTASSDGGVIAARDDTDHTTFCQGTIYEFKRNFAVSHDENNDSIIDEDYVEYFEAVTRT